MRAVRLWFILILGGATAVMCGSIGGHANSSGIGPESETLYLEKDPSTGRYLDSHALLYFKPELRTGAPADWNLRYGMLAINDEDWFEVSHSRGNRSVMADLGPRSWSDQFMVPTLNPKPRLRPGEQPVITIDSGGDTGKFWAETTVDFAKVVQGHMYEIHVKDDNVDFYALFRVQEHQQRDHCKISWKLVDQPIRPEK